MDEVMLNVVRTAVSVSIINHMRAGAFRQIWETDCLDLRTMGFRGNMIGALLDMGTPENGGTVVQVSLNGNAAAPIDP